MLVQLTGSERRDLYFLVDIGCRARVIKSYSVEIKKRRIRGSLCHQMLYGLTSGVQCSNRPKLEMIVGRQRECHCMSRLMSSI